MFTFDFSAAFKHIEKTDQIGTDVGFRMLNRMSHSCLGRQMKHAPEAPARKQLAYGPSIRQIPFFEKKIGIRR
jgi:hypothetical protein